MTTSKPAETSASRRTITLERTYRAPLSDIWDLWTTKDGIESWWGPGGFTVTVQTLDLRVGGLLLYTMTATQPEQIAFMKGQSMPLATPGRITYTEVTPPRRLVYTHAVDFVPGVAAYDVTTAVELFPKDVTVRMILTLDAMHDEVWTERAVAGWNGELAKLERVLVAK